MNEHLRSVVERDKRRKVNLISPICKLDAEIIWELIIALGRIEAYDIKSIVEHWKFLKDEDIYKLLLEWNIDHPEGIESDEEKEKNASKRKFIDFDGSIIEVWLIKSVHVDDYYNYMTNLLEYRIIINKNLPESFLLVDLVFSYPSIELRESQLKKLKKHLNKFIKIV